MLDPYKDLFHALYMCSIDSSFGFCGWRYFTSLIAQMLPLWLFIWFGYWLWRKL